MSVFDTAVKAVRPIVYQRTFSAGDINEGPNKTIDDIVFSNFHSFKLGSTDGASYGTLSTVQIPIAAAFYTGVLIGIRTGGGFFNRNITFRIDAITSNQNIRSKLFQATLNASSDVFCLVGDGELGLNGSAGTGTVAQEMFYSLIVPKGVPQIQIRLETTTDEPTTGVLNEIFIARYS